MAGCPYLVISPGWLRSCRLEPRWRRCPHCCWHVRRPPGTRPRRPLRPTRRRPSHCRPHRLPPACGDVLAAMSTRDKLAQLLMVGVTGAADARAVVADHHVGGIMIGSWTDLSMLSDGSLRRHRRLGRTAAAGGERRRGGRPGVAAGGPDRQPVVAAGARPDQYARRGVWHRARARPPDARSGHHHRLRPGRRRHRRRRRHRDRRPVVRLRRRHRHRLRRRLCPRAA